MTRRLRRALVRGERASFWLYADDNFVLRGSGPGEETDVPVSHLTDERLDEHLRRLRSKRWVPEGAVLELIAMAEQVRP